MINQNFSYSIKNLKLLSSNTSKINDNIIITSRNPFKHDKIVSIKPYTYTQKKIKIKITTFFTYKCFNSPNLRYTIFIKFIKQYP